MLESVRVGQIVWCGEEGGVVRGWGWKTARRIKDGPPILLRSLHTADIPSLCPIFIPGMLLLLGLDLCASCTPSMCVCVNDSGEASLAAA